MTTATKSNKSTKVLSISEATKVLTPAVQRQLKSLRTSRDLEKEAKSQAETARKAILDFFGELTTDIVGTDAKGKRLVSVKVIKSSEKIEWELLEQTNPELYTSIRSMLADYIIPKGEGKPTIRVDVL